MTAEREKTLNFFVLTPCDLDYLNSLVEAERSEELDLILQERIASDDELGLGHDVFATEDHEKMANLARKHRRALKKSKHDIHVNWRNYRIDDFEKAMKEKGYKSFPYNAGEDDQYNRRIRRKHASARDFYEQLREYELNLIDEIPCLWTEEPAYEPVEIDSYEYDEPVEYPLAYKKGFEEGYEKGAEDLEQAVLKAYKIGYQNGYEAGYQKAREEFKVALAKFFNN